MSEETMQHSEFDPDLVKDPSAEPHSVVQRFPWVYAIILGLTSIAGSVLVVPFSMDLMKQLKNQPQIIMDLLPVIMVIQVGIESIFSIAMIALGLGLGRSLGLAWPPLAGWGAFVMIGNGIPGVVFGWLFWRKGLIAAMVSHTMFDVVTKVVIPAFSGG